MDYILIRSRRKTLALRLRPDGTLELRAPLLLPKREIERFLLEKRGWIEKQRAAREREAGVEPLSAEELRALGQEALRRIPERVSHFAPLVGVRVGRITIRCQKSRWGSCSSQGNLNFNCLLMLAPEEVLDYVVVHELCHRLEMNHSPRFWSEVERVLPEYRGAVKWLKTEGGALMARAHGRTDEGRK